MKPKLIILTGPTGVGKTELSLSLAKEFQGEIISADSMQIYKHMDIGTAKIEDNHMREIPHYLVDIVEPWEEYSVAEFQKQAKEFIVKINNKKKIPIVVGGTGLYINSLLYNWDFQKTASDPQYRKELNALSEEKGVSFLYSQLEKKDPKMAKSIEKNNKNRIIRALELLHLGQKKENKNLREETHEYNLVYIALTMDRPLLYERINKRVDQMIEKGLVDEVKNILKTTPLEAQSLKAIGYKEIIQYLHGEMSLEDAIGKIKQHSRNYAKRQITWFKRDQRLKWFDKNKDSQETILQYIRSCIEKF